MLESGKRLLSERERLELSALDVYSSLDIHQNTYRNYEKGNRDIPSSTLNKMWAMGFDINYIVTGEYSDSTKHPKTADNGNKMPKRLIDDLSVDSNNLSDLIYTMAYNLETAIINSGGVANEDYKLLDLFKMSESYAVEVFKTRDNIKFDYL